MAEEEVDAHILKKYEIVSKLGKGVSSRPSGYARRRCQHELSGANIGCCHAHRPTALFGRPSTGRRAKWLR